MLLLKAKFFPKTNADLARNQVISRSNTLINYTSNTKEYLN